MFPLLATTRLLNRQTLYRPLNNNRSFTGTQFRQQISNAAMKRFADIKNLQYSESTFEYAASLTELGHKLIQGDGIKQDIPFGINLLLLACTQNCAAAEMTISKLYEQGIGFRKDPQMAELHYNRSIALAKSQTLKE